MQSGMPRSSRPLEWWEAVSEVRFRGRAEADARAGLRQEVELPRGRVRPMHDRRPGAQAAGLGEELDRPQAVLRETLLDLARLFVRVDVQNELRPLGVASDLLEPRSRAGANGVGRQPDPRALGEQLLHLVEVLPRRRLPEALEPAAPVRREQEDELDAGLAGRLHHSPRLLEPDIVELADRRIAGPRISRYVSA